MILVSRASMPVGEKGSVRSFCKMTRMLEYNVSMNYKTSYSLSTNIVLGCLP